MAIRSSTSSSEKNSHEVSAGTRLRALLCFIVANAAIYVFVNSQISKLPPAFFRGDIQFYKSIKALEKRAADVNFLFVGDSHMYYGLNPDDIKFDGCAAHNFGFASESSQSSYWKVKHYIDRGKLPELKALFMEITMGRPPTLSFISDYSRFYNDLEIAANNNPVETLRVVLLKRSLLLRIRPAISSLNYTAPDELKERPLENGYSLRTYSYQPTESDERIILRDKNKLVREKFSAGDGRFYRKIYDLMKEHNVEVYFVVMPTLFGDKELSSQLYKANVRYIRQYIPGATALDYSLNRYPWEPSLFSDRGHLNEKGAETLGRLIEHDMKTQHGLNRLSCSRD